MTAVDLDALDAARAAATPGPWHADREAIFALGPMAVAETNSRADAALIVAAVNALPALTADARKLRALREAVEGLADTLDRQAKDMESVRADAVAAKPADPVTLYADSVARNVAKEWTKIARRLRAVLAAALTSEGERE